VLSGHLTYRLFLWLAPFVLVVVAMLGIGIGDRAEIERLLDDLSVGGSLSGEIASQTTVTLNYALTIGLFGLVYATWSLIRALHYVFAQIWQVDIVPPRTALRTIGWALGGAIAVVSMFAVVALSRGGGLILQAGGVAAALLINVSLLFVLSWFLPRRTDTWFELLPGAIVAATLMTALQLVAQVWLPQKAENASALYGGIGTAFATLFYLWLLASLLIGSAFLNSTWADRHVLLAGRPLIADPDRLPDFLRRPTERAVRLWRRWVPPQDSE
jgi:uncharacterized BrkB/YihY/UPF0761 family membrane protein